jgi:predicted nucleic acid-binding protein
MSAERVTLDTNILIYSVDADAGGRQSQARELVRRTARHYDAFLTLQTLSEFFAAVTRKEKLSPSEAAAQVADYQKLFPVVAATPDSLRRAINAVQKHGLSFWDAMQWAVARQAGATLLLSEDFQHGRELEGVHFRDPFRVEDPFATG